jgi:aspartokinase/homoserine dehydrogenase 1
MEPGIRIIAGSAARDPKGNTLVFGKGGGDLSASFFAGLMKADEIDIWSSQHTYTTADPRIVKNAKTISEITYEEAIELSHFENNLVAPAALNNAIKKRIPIYIRAFENMNGVATLIHHAIAEKTEMISGISSMENIALISIEGSGMIGVPGFAKRVFAGLNDAAINVILISQGSSEHSICVAVRNEAKHQAIQILDNIFEIEISNGIIQPITSSGNVSIIALVGENMRNHPGISGRMFGSLGRNGVNVLAIAQGSNERNISAVIHSADRKKAINVLHESFFEDAKKELNLFIVGTGNVGKKLIEQIRKQADKIGELHKIKMNVVGLCNSRKMIVQQQGINLEQWEQTLGSGEDSYPSGFADQMTALNLRNSVLVDITANEIIPGLYASLLKKSMSVVACNKIAASDHYLRYKELKELAISYNCKFLFETNVGAALPIISTLNDIIKSGDKINKMEAVLSGTLNFVFNNYNGSRPFSSVVRDAQDQGFTEPDPRLDLSGKDVMRKIMILSREAGVAMEMKDIQCNGFLPETCMNGSVADFYQEMEKHEAHFKSLLDQANANNAKLKFVASFENGKAIVGLQQIKPESDMFHLYGKDNIVLFYTERYDQQPLVIKGAGAGAEVTASGVFADVLRTINN